MQRGSLAGAFSASCSIHVLLLIVLVVAEPAVPGRGPGGSLSVELRFDAAGLSQAVVIPDAPPADVAVPPLRKPPARAVPPPRPKRIEGVRVATREDLERRREEPPSVPAPEPVARPVPESFDEPAPAAAPEPPSAVARGVAPSGGGHPSSFGAARANGPAPLVVGANRPRMPGVPRPDALGYEGRIFGQRSVRAAAAGDAYYGRIHLFTEDGGSRDYSDASLFGFSFRHELGDGGVREFQVGRVQTHGAYLVVTDLFPNGRISTMSHTVVMPFPREAAAPYALWDVAEEGSGRFRLRGPAGSALVFDGRSGALQETRGFDVGRSGATGTPPPVSFRGLHVRIAAVGGNPFLRGRSATVVDAHGRRCALSTSDLFAYDGGRRESDMFRFASDREFFSFLEAYCPSLALPRPAEVLLAAPAPGEKKPEAAKSGGGLLPTLFRVFGGS